MIKKVLTVIKNFIIKYKAYLIVAIILIAAGIAGLFLYKGNKKDNNVEVLKVDEVINEEEEQKTKEAELSDTEFTPYELMEKMQQVPDNYIDRKYEIYGKVFKATLDAETEKYFVMVTSDEKEGENYTSVLEVEGYNEILDKAIEDDKYVKVVGIYVKREQFNDEIGSNTCSFVLEIRDAVEIEDEDFSITEIKEEKAKVELEEETDETTPVEGETTIEEEEVIAPNIEVDEVVDAPPMK